MSFYRTLLAAVAAIAIASPVLAEDAAAPAPAQSGSEAIQVSDNTNSTEGAAQQVSANSEEGKTVAEQTKINLNKASVKELVKVKGLNASKARAIVAYRKKHGDFKSTDELSHVKGFKKMNSDNMKEISDQLTIN